MKLKIFILLPFFMMAPLMMAKIEILDRVAIIVGEGVVLESQVEGMMQNIKKRYSEQGAA